MKLWIISQNMNNGYDTFDSAVVAAETEEDARNIDVDGSDWKNGRYTAWANSPDQVHVEYIGYAGPDIKFGVVLASFNAG